MADSKFPTGGPRVHYNAYLVIILCAPPVMGRPAGRARPGSGYSRPGAALHRSPRPGGDYRNRTGRAGLLGRMIAPRISLVPRLASGWPCQPSFLPPDLPCAGGGRCRRRGVRRGGHLEAVHYSGPHLSGRTPCCCGTATGHATVPPGCRRRGGTVFTGLQRAEPAACRAAGKARYQVTFRRPGTSSCDAPGPDRDRRARTLRLPALPPRAPCLIPGPPEPPTFRGCLSMPVCLLLPRPARLACCWPGCRCCSWACHHTRPHLALCTRGRRTDAGRLRLDSRLSQKSGRPAPAVTPHQGWWVVAGRRLTRAHADRGPAASATASRTPGVAVAAWSGSRPVRPGRR